MVHDYLYRSKRHAVSRPEADAILWAAMIACGTPLWKRVAIYAGVRLGGWGAFYQQLALRAENFAARFRSDG